MDNYREQIRIAVRETADLMRPFSLSFSKQYASPSADRLAIAKEFAAVQEHITPEFRAVALMAVRVAVLENNIKTSASIEGGNHSGIK